MSGVPKAAIGLGSNLGDRLGHLRTALAKFAVPYRVVRVSSLYLTEPIGGPDQDEFLNAAAVIETAEPPLAILTTLQRIEDEMGRVRDQHWGPRNIDLDLLVVDGMTSAGPELILPHPRAHLRRFVVAPLAEVWPAASLQGGKAIDLLPQLIDQQAVKLADEWAGDRFHFVDRGARWLVGQGLLFLLFGVVVVLDGTWPSSAWRWLGLVPMALAALLMLRAAASLGDSLTPYPTPRLGHLATTGVYNRVRHPMYAGVVLLFLGTAVLVGSAWVAGVALVGAAFLWLKASFEEKRLRIVYPAYDEYRRNVRSRLIPGLW